MPTPDPIKDLLRQADRAAGSPPAGRSDLAPWVVREGRRRHRIRTGVGAGVAAVAVTMGVFVLVNMQVGNGPATNAPSGTVAANGPGEVGQLKSEIARIRDEADRASALAKRLCELRDRQARLAKLERKLPDRDPLDVARAEVNRAAFMVVCQADRMHRDLQSPRPAVEAYREAIELFPDTPSAQVARQRLAEIQPDKGDLL